MKVKAVTNELVGSSEAAVPEVRGTHGLWLPVSCKKKESKPWETHAMRPVHLVFLIPSLHLSPDTANHAWKGSQAHQTVLRTFELTCGGFGANP